MIVLICVRAAPKSSILFSDFPWNKPSIFIHIWGTTIYGNHPYLHEMMNGFIAIYLSICLSVCLPTYLSIYIYRYITCIYGYNWLYIIYGYIWFVSGYISTFHILSHFFSPNAAPFPHLHSWVSGHGSATDGQSRRSQSRGWPLTRPGRGPGNRKKIRGVEPQMCGPHLYKWLIIQILPIVI